MDTGALALVVGPSGAGKDTLIGAAREALAGDERYLFVRRIVTRKAFVHIEDHDSIDFEDFARQKAKGAFALDWEAHGLHYALPAAVDGALLAGRIVVANVSRAVIPAARRKYPNCCVLLVTAGAEVRASRLLARGRERKADIEARLAREGAPVPAGLMPIMIDNSGALEIGVRGFLGALRALAR